jgi:hypothetical protein
MTHTFELIVRGGTVVNHDGRGARDRAALPPYDGITVLGRCVIYKGEILEPAGGEPGRFCEA